MFQNLALPAAQEVRDSNSAVTSSIVMKNDGVLYHQVSSFSPERWTVVLLQERAVVGSVYPINVIHHNEHHLHSTFFGQGEPECFHSFYWRFMFG